MEQETNANQSSNVPEPTSSGQGKSFIAVAIIVIVLGLGAYFIGNKEDRTSVSPGKESSDVAQKKEATSSDSSVYGGAVTKNDASVKSFNISSKPFEFSTKEIKVKKGDKVRINLSVEQGMHDWVIDEFSARTKQITTGQTDSVEFVADKTGTFEYYCSVGTHRQMGMVGKLIVE